MGQSQEDIIKYYKAKLGPPQQEKGLLPLLRILASQSLNLPVSEMPIANEEKKKPVTTRIPDMAKLQANMDRNELMIKYPGMGAR